MKTSILCLVAFLATLVTGLYAAELNPSRIPDSTNWLLHADFDAIRSSETGETVFNQVESEYGAKLRALKRMFSFHLINDVYDITLFGNGKPKQAVLLLHGKFDRAHITDVIAAKNYTVSDYKGITVHSWTDENTKHQNAVFAADNLIVFSEQPALLHEALDQISSGTTRETAPFFTAAGRPLVSAMARLGEIDMPADASRILRMARVLRIAMNENDGRFFVRVGAESESQPNAKRLQRILDGIVAFAEATDVKLENVDLQSKITTTSDPVGVDATLSLPIPQWLDLMKKSAAERDAKKAN
jgi:hypothetical protein